MLAASGSSRQRVSGGRGRCVSLAVMSTLRAAAGSYPRRSPGYHCLPAVLPPFCPQLGSFPSSGPGAEPSSVRSPQDVPSAALPNPTLVQSCNPEACENLTLYFSNFSNLMFTWSRYDACTFTTCFFILKSALHTSWLPW